METYSFTLVVSGVDLMSDKTLDALFEAGCDDTSPFYDGGTNCIHFDRSAPTFREALISALNAVQTVVGLEVVRVEPSDLVGLAEVAEFSGRTRESARLLANGERGPGDFPGAAYRSESSTRSEQLWLRVEVLRWLRTHDLADVTDEELEAAVVVRLANLKLQFDRAQNQYADFSDWCSTTWS